MNLSELRSMGILASEDTNGGLSLDAPEGALSAELVASIRQHKPLLLAEIRAVRDECDDGEHCPSMFTPVGKVYQPPAKLTPPVFEHDFPVDRNRYNLPTVPDVDPRITCRACSNLSHNICTVARPGGVVSATRGYRPPADTLQNCLAFEILPP